MDVLRSDDRLRASTEDEATALSSREFRGRPTHNMFQKIGILLVDQIRTARITVAVGPGQADRPP